MKSKIKTMEFSRLRNEEHFEFHSEFAQLANGCALTETFQSLVRIYDRSYQELNDSLEVIRRSVHTAEMAVADKWRTATYRRLSFAVEEYRQHYDPVRCQAAERIFIIIDHYRNLSRAPRDTKTASLMNMIGDLRERTAADLQLLGLADWVSELEENNERYKRLKSQRHTEHAERPAKKVPEARQAVDADYEAVIYHLAVHVKLNPADEEAAVLIAGINTRVESCRWLLAQRRGVTKARREAEE